MLAFWDLWKLIYDFSDWVPWCYILKSHWRSQMGVDFGRLRVVLPVAIIEVLETISGGPSLHQLMCWFYEFYLGFYTSWGGCWCLPPSVFLAPRKAVAKLVKVDDRDIFVAACEVRGQRWWRQMTCPHSHRVFENKVIESQRVEVLSDHWFFWREFWNFLEIYQEFGWF